MSVNPKNFLALATARYSCRSYLPQEIEEEKLNYLMSCVRMAPSAVNRQPWRFRIIHDKAMLQVLWKSYPRDWFRTAPVVVVASVVHAEEWVRKDGKAHGNIDVAIAVEHLCLAATEQGLGSCWVCNFDTDVCKQLFAMTEDEDPVVLIPLGYPADTAKEKARKDLNAIFSVNE